MSGVGFDPSWRMTSLKGFSLLLFLHCAHGMVQSMYTASHHFFLQSVDPLHLPFCQCPQENIHIVS
jgi:hypothetical protein